MGRDRSLGLARHSAAAELDKRSKAAEAVRLEGEAEARAIEAKGAAEAEALRQKAEAFKQYNDAAVTQMVVDMLPKLAGEVAKPMANIDGLTIVSTDGASKLTGTTADILSQTTAVARELGVDLTAIFNGLGKSSSVNELPPSPVKTDEK